MSKVLSSRILSAGVWSAASFGGQKVLQLASNLLLTRLLYPEAFGLMALANVVLIGLQMLSDVGIKPAIIQHARGGEPEFLNTAWSIQVVRGFLLWAVACLAAYPASVIYKSELLFPLICVLGSTAAITGFASISLASSERNLLVKRISLVQFTGQLVSLSLTALFCWYYKSVWSLAIGGIAGACVTTAFSHWFLPHHRHRFMLDSQAMQSMSHFGRWIFLSTLVTFFSSQGLRAIQGTFMTTTEIGILSIAQNFAAMPTELMLQLMALVAFPALSEAHLRSRDEMQHLSVGIKTKILLVIVPAFLVLGLISGPLIGHLYDARYQAAGEFLAILAFGGAIATVPIPYQNAFLAMGNARLHTVLLLVVAILRIVGMVVGFELGSTNTMLVGIGAGSLLGYIYVAYEATKAGIGSLKVDLFWIGFILAVAAGWFTLLPH